MNIQDKIRNKIKSVKSEFKALQATKQIAKKKAGASYRKALVEESEKVAREKAKSKVRSEGVSRIKKPSGRVNTSKWKSDKKFEVGEDLLTIFMLILVIAERL